MTYKTANSWEQRKAGELSGKAYGGGTPSTSNSAFWNGEIPWIQSSDIHENDVMNTYDTKSITDEGAMNSAAQIIPGNSIALIIRVGVGKVAYIRKKYATSQDFLSLSRLSIDVIFGTYLFSIKMKEMANSTQGTSIKGVSKEEIMNMLVSIPPSDVEQKMIGHLFGDLDSLITLHQRKP